ncbi:MAG: DUF3488 domain-containing protein [Thermoanaerobaculia bacterium]|nr:DUF3488 domain-containing protein [Thermoanaerobaculia bacterium]
MNHQRREIEMLAVTMFAAAPLYLTGAVGMLPLLIFHGVMLGIGVRVLSGRGPELLPGKVMRLLALGYILFYFFDAVAISRSAIAASTHLVLFIAVYQPIESLQRNNLAQRLLTTTLIFVASLATSTHITIVLFVLAFAFLMFRQLIYVSHMETVRSLSRPYDMEPSSRSAIFYLLGTVVLGAMLFPFLPRLRNPVVRGFTGPLSNATSGLSEAIDFNETRTSTPDAALVARVWMNQDAIPFFTPLRLRGAIYDRFENNRWLQGPSSLNYLTPRDGVFHIARPVGYKKTAIVQQRIVNERLYIPSDTYAISGVQQLIEGPKPGSYTVFGRRGDLVSFEASMARETEPLLSRRVPVTGYPVTPEVAALARQIVAGRNGVRSQANAVEQYLLRNYQYYQQPEQIGRRMTTDDFLLREKRGHCEYFAAGMVALMTAVDVPARIAGGFYGGRLNPLTGYFMVRREDAHAWVEVWDGKSWVTFDPTPPSLRPGSMQGGLLQAYLSAISDSVHYFWDRYVLTFGVADQIALAAEMITRGRDAIASMRSSAGSIGNVLLSPRGFAILLALIAALYLGATIARRPSAFDMLARHLRARGIEIGPAMTLQEGIAQLNAADAVALAPLIALYEEEQFSSRRDSSRRRLLRSKLQELR